MDSTTAPVDSVQGLSSRLVTGPYTVPRSASFASLAEMIRRRTLPTNQSYQDSFGEQLKDLGNQMRWDLAGTALQEWDEIHFPRLQNVMTTNAKEIYKGENDADCHIIRRCYMLGCDKSHAHPTIVLFCNGKNFKRILKRTMKVIHRADEFSENGFKLLAAGMPDLEFKGNLTGCAAEITHPMYDQATSGPISLCGQQIRVNKTTRCATIGGTIIIDGSYYALTVAHPFSEASYGYTSSRQSSQVELFTMEWALGNDNDSDDDSDDESDDGDTAYDSGHGSVDSFSLAPRDPIVCLVTPPSPEPEEALGTEDFDHAGTIRVAKSNLPMDWVTMRLKDQRFFAANEVFLPSDDSVSQGKHVYLEREKRETPAGGTIIVDGKEVLKAGSVSAMCTGKLKNSGTEIALWALSSPKTLSKGICGSWALDSQTHEILGPVVAGSETLGEIFIVPMKDILKSVQEEHGASEVSFPMKTDSLWLAVYYGNTPAVERLLRAFDKFPSSIPQAPIRDDIFSHIHRDGMTMLHWSAWKGYRKILEKLCAAGGDINERTKSMKTPLHLACFLSPEQASSSELKRRKESTVGFLLSQEGIDINARDKEEKTPFMIAEETGFKFAKDLFEKNGKTSSIVTDETAEKTESQCAKELLAVAKADDVEYLDRTYTRHESSFFVPGRMFATPILDSLSEASLDRYKRNTTPNGVVERGSSLNRQFIVVKEGRGFCYACPVSTYGGRGTTREGLTPRTHAIVYTMDSTPTYVDGEAQLSKSPIPVVPGSDGVRLELSSRIDFAIYYPIHHVLLVKDLGMVHEDYIKSLVRYAKQESEW